MTVRLYDSVPNGCLLRPCLRSTRASSQKCRVLGPCNPRVGVEVVGRCRFTQRGDAGSPKRVSSLRVRFRDQSSPRRSGCCHCRLGVMARPEPGRLRVPATTAGYSIVPRVRTTRLLSQDPSAWPKLAALLYWRQPTVRALPQAGVVTERPSRLEGACICNATPSYCVQAPN